MSKQRGRPKATVKWSRPSIGSCSVENTPSNIEAEDSGVALTDNLCCIGFQHEQDDDNQSGNDMVFCHDEETVNELTDSTLC